jgi:hypothetical protein
MYDFHYLAEVHFLGSIFTTFSKILSDCVGAKINLSKSSLNVLQAATIVNPADAMQP